MGTETIRQEFCPLGDSGILCLKLLDRKWQWRGKGQKLLVRQILCQRGYLGQLVGKTALGLSLEEKQAREEQWERGYSKQTAKHDAKAWSWSAQGTGQELRRDQRGGREGGWKVLSVAAWLGGGSGRGWIHVYVWLSAFAGHLKLSRHC